MKKIIIPVNASGSRVGEAHQRAILSDDDVEDIRSAWETEMFTLSQIAKRYGVSKTIVHDIVTFRRRATAPDRFKTLREDQLKKPIPRSQRIDMFAREDEILDIDTVTGLEAVAEMLGIDEMHVHDLLDEQFDEDPYA